MLHLLVPIFIFSILFCCWQSGIKQAVDLAQKHVRENGTILPDIELKVIDNNDGCHLDTVMRTFINYYVRPDMILGVLGPPCSETVEPIASKCISNFLFLVVVV